MKLNRFLPVISLPALLLVTMGVGPCDSQPLGDTDCVYGGQAHKRGEWFPASDGCNSCSCNADGTVLCTEIACADGGIPGATDGGAKDGSTVFTCVDANGKVYPTGTSFPSTDGCNTCTCDGKGMVACTTKACATDAGVPTGDGGKPTGDGGTPATDASRPMTCTYAGSIYAVGTSFFDGCNTCTCTVSGQIACTAKACVDGGTPVGDGGMPASDAGTGVCIYNGSVNMPGTTFPSSDGCNTCSCDASGSVVCTKRACPADAGAPPPPDGSPASSCITSDGAVYADGSTWKTPDGCQECACKAGLTYCSVFCSADAGTGMADGGTTTMPPYCTYAGLGFQIGDSFTAADGCNTCFCTKAGIACTLNVCPAPAGACTPGKDQTCNEDPALGTLLGKCQANGTCACYDKNVSPYTGRCLDPSDTAGKGCEWGGAVIPVGGVFMCGACGPCTCVGPGKIQGDTSCG